MQQSGPEFMHVQAIEKTNREVYSWSYHVLQIYMRPLLWVTSISLTTALCWFLKMCDLLLLCTCNSCLVRVFNCWLSQEFLPREACCTQQTSHALSRVWELRMHRSHIRLTLQMNHPDTEVATCFCIFRYGTECAKQMLLHIANR